MKVQVLVVGVSHILVGVASALLIRWTSALVHKLLVLRQIKVELGVVVIWVKRRPALLKVIPFFASVIIIIFVRKIILLKVVKIHLNVRVVDHKNFFLLIFLVCLLPSVTDNLRDSVLVYVLDLVCVLFTRKAYHQNYLIYKML